MTWTLQDLDALREGWDFEAKKAAGQNGQGAVPRAFWESYSAMANGHGGHIVLGVSEDKAGRFKLHGLQNPHKVERELWDLLCDRNKVSANLLSVSDVNIQEIDGVSILVIQVPPAARGDKPVHLGKDPFSGSYLRINDGDRKLPADRVRRMLADAERDRPADSQVLRHLGLDDLHAPTLQAYRNLLSARSPDHPFLRQEGSDFLRSLGMWGRDPDSGASGLKKAGLLLFGKEASIKDVFPSFFVDYQRIDADADRWSHRIFCDGTWNANLLEFYWRVIPELHRDLDLPFSLGADMVRAGETPVHQALREALVNSLIHADYSARQGVRVEHRVDQFLFKNPGSMLLDRTQARRGGESECRNPSLQGAFTLVGLGERAGSGVPKILQAWHNQHWRAPVLEDDLERGMTSLTLTRVSLLPAEALSGLQKQFPSFSQLSTLQRLTLATAKTEGRVANLRLQQLSSEHPRDLSQMLSGLVQDGYLVAHGERRGRFYTLPGASTQASETPYKTPYKTSSGVSQNPLLEGLSQDVQGKLMAIQAAKWAQRTDIEAVLTALCATRFWSARELATLLNRSPQTIRNTYLKPMVRAGLLRLEFPHEPASQRQRYGASTLGEE